ncbi:hypothetical protein GVO57_14520 (plasmid) [Sphingomonas changnyeongensis]|uniref:Uncharacterized protein n=1 Tax=Sphingomonas changnyeongensis TaxID=2698679 RepID=A0A7Z2S979_9SPHN|nr:hypothetical protein [Sphingomonas changnyeongensis]QHL92086.1 hypothetical protein GVO57_14520 [Sphingomonas changnyeongensis]
MQWHKSMLGLALVLLSVTVAAKPGEMPQRDLVVRNGEAVAMKINDRPVLIRLAPDAISVPT